MQNPLSVLLDQMNSLNEDLICNAYVQGVNDGSENVILYLISQIDKGITLQEIKEKLTDDLINVKTKKATNERARIAK